MRHEHGVKARARVNRIVDGDTIEIIVQYPVTIRLRNCWAPEIHGVDRIAGEKAKDALSMIAPPGTFVTVWIPTDEAKTIGGVMSFGRVVADVWIQDDDETLADHMIAMGHATREKEKGQ